MLQLAIETSSARGSLALFRDGALLREAHFPEGLLHGREIAARLGDLLRLEGSGPRDLNAISVGVGPGSYTGIRVAVTTAKTLAFCLRIPVVTESSLMVTASNALASMSAAAELGGEHVLPVLDGRQGTYFWGLFRVSSGLRGRPPERLERLHPDKASDAGEIAAVLESLKLRDASFRRALVVGAGAELLLAEAPSPLLERGPSDWDLPLARMLGELTSNALRGAGFDLEAVHRLEPCYLRATEAERKLAHKEKP